ncbi:MAG: sulfopyruvate decarboxylase subunit beta [Nitrospiraceae bacterium]|nr:sulfopyruvate decarboxylase subunit beta [Nitrospiraceae bacterium]
MFNPEAELISILKTAGVGFTASLPCEKIKVLLEMIGSSFQHLPLTREEEGVGICAGAALAGRRPAMFVQSSGIGNMLNALLSLTQFYELPLALFVSQRGIYKERIAAQLPMGQRLPGILRGAGIPFTPVSSHRDFGKVRKKLGDLYAQNRVHAFLLSPSTWEGSEAGTLSEKAAVRRQTSEIPRATVQKRIRPRLTRMDIIRSIAPHLASKAVVCNLGIPSKELYAARHQPSNFYMLGSMGMVTPIGLGISLCTGKEVVVIDGDGSILMNPGTLATIACSSPRNLTIVGIDNSAYGSTGNQPTLTDGCIDLENLARGFGISNTVKVATAKDLRAAMKGGEKGPRFIHALAVPGNSDSPNIPLGHIAIKEQVMRFLSGR